MEGGRTAVASWELPEALWQLLHPLLPVRNQRAGRPTAVDLRRVAAGIFYVLRTGIQWNAVPRQQFGAPSTVYYCFRQWRDAGVFEQLWARAVGQSPNLCADRDYDFGICRAQVHFFGYPPHIRARREEAQERAVHPGWRPRRWVVEVTHSWLNRFRKLLVRFEELDDSYRALLHFACAYIALKRAGSF